MQPTALGRYEVRDVLGRGNMGVVYLGHDPVIDRPVALKSVALPESITEDERTVFLERFFLEARAAGKLTHPNVVVTFDAATDEATGIPFIAMELVNGKTLAELLREKGSIHWEEAVALAVPIASGLQKAHEAGIVHRDIKPANIILGDGQMPKIADFGIAKLPASNLTQEGAVIGTPYFMSPEHLKGEALDGRSDLFSLGAMLYNLIAGRPPFQGADPASVFSQTLYKDPTPLTELAPDAPAALDRVVSRALAKDREARYPTALEFIDDLRALMDGRAPAHGPRPSSDAAADAQPTLVTPTGKVSVPERSRPWARPAAMAAIVIALLCGVGLRYHAGIGREIQLWKAERAAAAGSLVESEAILQSVLEEEPTFERGITLIGGVSEALLEEQLPIEFSARHNHRLGHCKGSLSLHGTGLEFASRKHSWSWSFENIQELESSGKWAVTVTTSEDELMGLLDSKRYVFQLQSAPLDRGTWDRYQRIYDGVRLASEP